MAVRPLASSSPFKKLQKIKWGNVQVCDPKIGEGSYAKVYDLKWNGTSYAGKKFKPSMSIATLRREIQHWSSLRHPNIVLLCGVTFKEEDESKPLLVMERMEISLSRHLKETARSQDYALLPFVTKVSILCQVAKALAHIHLLELLHGDLTANNVLLSNVNSGSVVAKVSDFGMSRSASETVSTATLGSLCYLPPEVDNVPPEVTQKVDVYSFGVLAIHCITHKCPKRLPASKTTESGLQPRTEVERFSHVLKEFRTDDKQLLPLIERCVHNDPRRRPEADTVCREVAYLEESMRKSASESPGPSKSTSAPEVHYHNSVSGCIMDCSTLNLFGPNCPASQPPSEPDQNEVERANIPAIGSEQPITRSREESAQSNKRNLGRFSSTSGGHSDHQLSPISNSDPSVPATHGAVTSGSQKRGPRALQTETATPKPLPDPLKFEYRKIVNDSENPLNRQYSSYIPKYQHFSGHGVDVVEFDKSLYFYQLPHFRLNRRNKAGQLQEILFQRDFDSDGGRLTVFSVAATTSPPAIHVASLHHRQCCRSIKNTECSCSVNFVIFTLDLSQSAANSEFVKNQITPLPVPKFLFPTKCCNDFRPVHTVMLLSVGLGSLLIVGVVKEQQVILMGIDLSQRLPQWTVLSQFTFPSSCLEVYTEYKSGQLLQFNSHLLFTYNQLARMVPLEDVWRAVMTNSAVNKGNWQHVLPIPTECGKLAIYRGHLLCVGGTAMVEIPSRCGGAEEYQVQPQGAVYVYNPDSYDPEWKYVGCLNTPRTRPALFVKDDRLYVVGGRCEIETDTVDCGDEGFFLSGVLEERIAADEVSAFSLAITENDHVEEPAAKRSVHTKRIHPSLPFPHA